MISFKIETLQTLHKMVQQYPNDIDLGRNARVYLHEMSIKYTELRETIVDVTEYPNDIDLGRVVRAYMTRKRNDRDQ